MQATDARLGNLASDITVRYGIDAVVSGPTRITLRGVGSLKRLHDLVWADDRLDALGRGWYLGAGGEFSLVEMPSWTFDVCSIAWARLAAETLKALRVRSIVRWFARG